MASKNKTTILNHKQYRISWRELLELEILQGRAADFDAAIQSHLAEPAYEDSSLHLEIMQHEFSSLQTAIHSRQDAIFAKAGASSEVRA